MRNRGDRPAILPLLVVLFTSALGARAADAAATSTAPPAGGGEAATSGNDKDKGKAKDDQASPAASPSPSGVGATSSSSESAPAATAVSASAAATEPDTAAKPPLDSTEAGRRLVPSLSHDLQFGLAVMPGGGYRIVIPYKDTVDCGDANNNMARVCTNRSPFFIDLQPSFGISESWDFLVDVRLGIENNVFQHHEIYLMPGFRYWLETQSHVKFYVTIQGAYDMTKQNVSTVSGYDLALRNSNGLMVEIMRNFGAYFQFGETIGFVRWLSFGVDAGIGVQARVP
jgi:hypothetical protein